jgi:hypothetical protein
MMSETEICDKNNHLIVLGEVGETCEEGANKGLDLDRGVEGDRELPFHSQGKERVYLRKSFQ